MLAPKPESEIFRENVRRRMEVLGLTQVTLAEKSKLTQPSISAILSGHSEPRLSNAKRIADALETTVDALLAVGFVAERSELMVR